MNKRQKTEIMRKRGRTAAMILLFVVVIAYMTVYVADAFATPFSTADTVLYTAEELLTLSGWFVRDEKVICSDSSGVWEAAVGEGEKVSSGELVAVACSNENAREINARLTEAQTRYAQLKVALGGNLDISAINAELYSSFYQLAYSSTAQDYTDAGEMAVRVRALLMEREVITGASTTQAEAELQALEQEITQLKQQVSSVSAQVWAPNSGYFSSVLDGYEESLSLDMTDELTVEAVKSFAGEKRYYDSSVCCGKMINGFDWQFVTLLSDDQAELFTEGERVTMRFSEDYIGGTKVKVERIGESEDGSRVVIFSSNKLMSELAGLRRQTVDIIFSEYTGLRVPREALRIDEDGKLGVYVLVAYQANFVEVEKLYETDSICVVVYDRTGKGLRPGDSVVVKSKNLYDGKVIMS